MNKRLLFTLFALTISACETPISSKKPIESSQLQEPIAETTPVSRIVPETTPSSIPTSKAVPEINSTVNNAAQSTKPLPAETLQAVPPGNPIAKSTDKPVNSTQEIKQSTKFTDKPVDSTQEIKQSTKSTDKPANSTQEIKQSNKSTAQPVNSTLETKLKAKSTNNAEKPVDVNKLVANINSKIECGEVDQKYKIRVVTIAIANYNPQSFQGLSRKQIRQAVKKSIADYPERAEGLVQEYRSQFCTVAENPTATTSTPVDNKQQVSATTGEIIPPQSGTCKQLRARGIKNINVTANPWARKKDRDNDGIACESE
jgi:hypothetical protein